MSDFMKSTHCEKCGGRLFARESQALGICIECREGEDFHGDMSTMDLEDRIDAALADDVFAIEIPKENLL